MAATRKYDDEDLARLSEFLEKDNKRLLVLYPPKTRRKPGAPK